ncbi:MAG: cation:proton antiporter [Desulfobacteraceae bacterium]|nr:MAG: cation:proton antiporter [Desulfobacteraceae bacterium]
MSMPQIVSQFTLPMLGVAFALTLIRLLRGPTLADAVVALDLMAIIVIGFAAHYSVAMGEWVYLDVAVVMALIAFLATVAFAFFIRKRLG